MTDKKINKTEADTAKETDVAEAAIDAAQQASDVVAEKRSTEPVAVAKAGKRSAKAIEEKKEKEEKETRKAESKSDKSKSQTPVKAPRSRLERRGKRYREAAKSIDRSNLYKAKEAIDLAVKTGKLKFDSTVELHVRLNVDPKQADQNIRDSLVLPSGTGKTVKIAVFAEDEAAKTAKTAGADIAGTDEITKLLDKGTINFDVLISMPNMMARLSKYARILGPKGLMPNPKSGTVTNDVENAVKQAKAGRIEYRVDSTGIVHLPIGKVSFGNDKLSKNFEAVVNSIKSNKPSSIKGAYVKSAALTTTMGPSVRIAASEIA